LGGIIEKRGTLLIMPMGIIRRGSKEINVLENNQIMVMQK